MEGLVFIPDITGFTSFVKGIDMELLFKEGQPIPLTRLFTGFKKIYEAFNKKYQLLRLKQNVDTELSLKFILHYGDVDVYYIKGFKKLYGQTIIESHRLLKNNSDFPSYILITEDYINALKPTELNHSTTSWQLASCSSQLFTDLREISYCFFHYSREAAPFSIHLQ